MSNAVDVLFLDGPKHGIAHCVPRPVPVLIDGYVPTHTVIDGKAYRVALPPESEFSDDTIQMNIVASGFTPAWDLNPPYAPSPEQF